MRGWRALAVAGAVAIGTILFVAAVLEFLAPDLAYHLKDRIAESASGNRGRKLRIALGTATGSSFRVGTVLNEYLKETKGYELELVATSSPGNARALLDPAQRIDLAAINSADDEGGKSAGIRALAALESQYFFVIVPSESPFREIRDLTGAVNVGVRDPGQPPTIGERVFDYYGMTAPEGSTNGTGGAVAIVRPTSRGIVADFDSGHMIAATRTQFLQSELIEGALRSGRFRVIPIRDNEALARSIPGAQPGIIPSGLYGPARRVPDQPVPTIAVTHILVARADVPGRVVRDILEIVYNPRFARDVHFDLNEESGRRVGALPLHPAAQIYYHRNDLVTSDRLGRMSFVASGLAALAGGIQLFIRFRRSERVRHRRQLLGADFGRLQEIRRGIDAAPDVAEAEGLIREADELLWHAEQDAAADLLDAPGIESLRSLHQLCWRALEQRREPAAVQPRPSPPPVAAAAAPAPPETFTPPEPVSGSTA